MEVGLRVVRGPDWKWGEQDGGEGSVGTVVSVGRAGSRESPDKTVVVYWDMGWQTNYRVGYEKAFDLRLLDNGPVGVRHSKFICNDCHRQGIAGLRFRCAWCFDYDLCFMCYNDDKHDVSHRFLRFDNANSKGVELPAREGAIKKVLKGTFVGAKVRRGRNWEWGDQDGGAGRCGRVLEIKGWDNETWRSVVNVAWTSGATNIYRVGHKGNVDLICVEPSSPGSYYPEHLPVLGKPVEEEASANDEAAGADTPTVTFGVGERVKVGVDVDQLKTMQEGHGGWNPRMNDIVGVLGRVHRVTDKGDIRVFYPRINCRWTINPRSLVKVDLKISVGDLVRVSGDKSSVSKLQNGHGEWIQAMSSILGKKGVVTKIYADGDLRVNIDGQTWTLNPLVVHPMNGVDGSEEMNTDVTPTLPTQSANMSSLLSNLMAEQLDLNGSMNIHRIVRESAQGHLEVVRDYFLQHPDEIDVKSMNKTCLQVASHQGHLSIVRLLIGAGANVKVTDDEGDTPLHYAAFGNQSEVMKVLLESGAEVNALNSNSCTPLHISVSKKHSSCVSVLLSFSPNLNLQDSYGDTPLHDAVGNDCLDFVLLLTEVPGIDLDLRNKRGFNALHHAALKGNAAAAERLVAVSRQLTNMKKDDGFSPLHLAALNGHRSVCEVLIQLGRASIDLSNNRQQTPLMLAVSQGHCSVVELLVESGGSLSTADEDGDTPLHMALIKSSTIPTSPPDQSSSPELFRVFTELNNKEGVSEGMLKLGVAISCYLVEEGADLSQTNKKGETPLDLANKYMDGLSALLQSYVISEEERAKRRALKRRAECLVCSELSEENVKLHPCGHRPACEECSARMKKCLKCTAPIVKRTTKDGKVVAYRPRTSLNSSSTLSSPSQHSSQEQQNKSTESPQNQPQPPPADCLRYLETKIAEIEETHCCSICMERRRSVVFLCGHSACEKCSAELRVCHMCRKTITNKIHLY